MSDAATIPYPSDIPAYHDLMPLAGVAGVLATWTDGRGRQWAACLMDTYVRGHTYRLVEVPAGATTYDDLARNLLPFQGVRCGTIPFPDGANVLSRLLTSAFPGPSRTAVPWPGREGLVRGRTAARRAVEAIPLSEGLRHALHAALDHGPTPEVASVLSLRTARRAPLWDAVAFVITHPALGLSFTPDAISGASEATLVPHVLAHYGLTPAHVRRLRRDAPTSPVDTLAEHGLHTAGHVPPEWLPADTPGWEAYDVVSEMCKAASNELASLWRSLARASRGDWQGYLDRCTAATRGDQEPMPAGDRYALVAAANGITDMALAFAREAAAPMIAHVSGWKGDDYTYDEISVHAESVAYRLLVGAKALPAALESSCYWHERQAAFDVRDVGVDVAWPALIDVTVAMVDLGVEVVTVRDAASLREEGAPGPDRDGMPGLDHCVVTRLPGLAQGTSHLLSVRTPDGRRLSCAEVEYVLAASHQPGVVVVEHRGLRNAPPPQVAVSALERLCAMIAEGRLAVSQEAIKPRSSPWGDAVGRECGYDWRDATLRARALKAWAPLLPRWARGLTDGALVEAMLRHGAMPGRLDEDVTPWMPDYRDTMTVRAVRPPDAGARA